MDYGALLSSPRRGLYRLFHDGDSEWLVWAHRIWSAGGWVSFFIFFVVFSDRHSFCTKGAGCWSRHSFCTKGLLFGQFQPLQDGRRVAERPNLCTGCLFSNTRTICISRNDGLHYHLLKFHNTCIIDELICILPELAKHLLPVEKMGDEPDVHE